MTSLGSKSVLEEVVCWWSEPLTHPTEQFIINVKANFQVHLDKKKEQNQPQQQKNPQTIQRDKLRQQINGWNFFVNENLTDYHSAPYETIRPTVDHCLTFSFFKDI